PSARRRNRIVSTKPIPIPAVEAERRERRRQRRRACVRRIAHQLYRLLDRGHRLAWALNDLQGYGTPGLNHVAAQDMPAIAWQLSQAALILEGVLPGPGARP